MLRKLAIITVLATGLLGGPAWAEIERNTRSRSGSDIAEAGSQFPPDSPEPEAAERPLLGTPPPLLLTSTEQATALALAAGLQDVAASLSQALFGAASPGANPGMVTAAADDPRPEPEPEILAEPLPETEPVLEHTFSPEPAEADPVVETLTVFSAGQEPAAALEPTPEPATADEPVQPEVASLPVVMHDEPARDVPGVEMAEAPLAETTIAESANDEASTDEAIATEPAPEPAPVQPEGQPIDELDFRTSWQPSSTNASRTVDGTERQLPGEQPQPQYSDARRTPPAEPPVTATAELPEVTTEPTQPEPAVESPVESAPAAPAVAETDDALDPEPAPDPLDDYPLDELLGRQRPTRSAATEPATDFAFPETAVADPVVNEEPEVVVEPETAPEPETLPEPAVSPAPKPSLDRPAPRLGAPQLAQVHLPLDVAPGVTGRTAVAPVDPVLNLWPPTMPDYAVSPKITNISRGNPRKKQVALTFDDGPHPEFSSQLLAVLEFYDVPATFFFVGVQAQKYPHWVKMTHQSGHELANHTYDHFRLPKLPVEEKAYQIDEYQRLIEQLTGVTPRFLRPPGGQLDGQTSEMLTDRGMVLALWDVAINDTKNGKTREDTLKTAMRNIRPGSIVLCHDGIQATVDMLPELITTLRAQGYEFVTLSEMAAGL